MDVHLYSAMSTAERYLRESCRRAPRPLFLCQSSPIADKLERRARTCNGRIRTDFSLLTLGLEDSGCNSSHLMQIWQAVWDWRRAVCVTNDKKASKIQHVASNRFCPDRSTMSS